MERAERAGLFVVRAWVEAPTGEFRARVTFTTDLTAGREAEVVRTTDEADEVSAMVVWWLRSLRAERGSDGTVTAP